MDSEKRIIEVMKPLLKEYVAFTKGEVPLDWVNVRDERKRDVERSKRELEKLDKRKDSAIEYNKKAEERLPGIKELDEASSELIENNVAINNEELEAYPEKMKYIKDILAQAEYELGQAEVQIETRRQAKIAKIKQEISNRANEYIGENLEELEQTIDEKRSRLEEMTEKYEPMRQEAKKTHSIWEQIRLKKEKGEIEVDEEQYASVEEKAKSQIAELMRCKEEAYKLKQEIALEQGTLEILKYDSIMNPETIQNLVSVFEEEEKREQTQKEVKESKIEEKSVEDQKKGALSEFVSNNKVMKGAKKFVESVIKVCTKTKKIAIKVGTWITNDFKEVKLLVAGTDDIVISEEKIDETWQRNREKQEQQIREIREAKEKEQERQKQAGITIEKVEDRDYQGRIVQSSEKEMEKQLEEAKAQKTDIKTAIQRVSEVKIVTNEEQMKRWAEYRKAHNIDNKVVEVAQTNNLSQKQQLKRQEDKKIVVPEFIRDYKTKQEDETTSKRGIRLGGILGTQKLFQKKAKKNPFKEGLGVGLTLGAQKIFSEKIQQEGKEKQTGQQKYEGILFSGE